MLMTYRLWMIAACLACLASCAREPKPSALESASHALAEARSAIVREVKDPERAKQALGLVDEVERLLANAVAGHRTHDARIRSLNADYDATPDAFRASFADFNAKRNERQRRMVEANQQAKTLLTAAEWQALTKVREEMLEKTLRAGDG
jgi:hypothetical protein